MIHASLRRSLGTAVAAAAAFALLLVPASASGATLLRAPLTGVKDSVDRTCAAKPLGDVAGVVTRKLTAPSLGMVNARLSGGKGDWDLAVFDAATGDVVAGSSHAGSREVATGFVTEGQALLVQACAREGAGGVPRLAVGLEALDAAYTATPSLVRVIVPDDARMRHLQELGLDLTEHGGPNFVEVVLHGADDAATLKRAGFQYTVEVADLGAQSARHRQQDRAYSAAVESSGLPSGRTTYRRLFDYGQEMKDLADKHPKLVHRFTLPNLTYEGRPVEGLVISKDVRASDGKPVFLQMGAHHAREWPSAEHAMEWAIELVEGYEQGDERVTDLMAATRTVVVPVVNPDGFNISREAGVLGGRDGPEELVNMVAAVPGEYRRKNCRFVNDAEGGSCLQPSLGLVEPGVDPNRNYPGFWGGPGASDLPLAQDYRGPGPSSEPEVRNVRDLISKRHVTTLITNHTFSNLVLRPPGLQSQGATPDEEIYKALGDAMAAQNGYASQHGYELYDTTGTTEDWSYYATGGLGYTFEIGPSHFHPPYEDMVAEYEGDTEAADGGGGNREAYFLAQEGAADPSKHSVLSGRAPAGATLRLTKAFTTPSSQEGVSVQDRLETKLKVPAGGAFEWHINPSTRPLVAQERGRKATGEPSPPASFSGAPGLDAARPCADYETIDPACWRDHAFTVPRGEGVDNASATVRIAWPTPVSDWDLKVFEDSDGNGSVDESELVASSAQGATDSEEATFTEPLLEPGRWYVARVINFAAVEPYEGTVTFAGPQRFQPAQTEAWTLTCERGGEVASRQQVVIDRGQRKRLDLRSCSAGAP
ncbi:MAG: M14 family metallopeptidase [Actinomycetota bacterium]|nr:M14 family metallopeptidase [Actinomycetota bacterium]